MIFTKILKLRMSIKIVMKLITLINRHVMKMMMMVIMMMMMMMMMMTAHEWGRR